MKHHIYSLNDPRTNKVKYIGQTTCFEARYKQHLNYSKNENLNNWVNELKQLKLKPLMVNYPTAKDDWASRFIALSIDNNSPRF